MTVTLPNDADGAMQLGREAGAIPNRCASDCPYGHAAINLRIAWMDGFSRGRFELHEATGAAPATRA
ncbi:hypothetical protein MKK68_03825 [Methylobacterium sp. E-016]|uniref:hypothetical protein n=1 Tax=Methylobacterium sp. E-016 TaxID=2836556 RepID=UPI001FB8EF23|nr:hypothetical protein [Methylobacterium sp. E-016]MCJ2074780.1 hypothetical protein [Methylobacterium sp. E-016]